MYLVQILSFIYAFIFIVRVSVLHKSTISAIIKRRMMYVCPADGSSSRAVYRGQIHQHIRDVVFQRTEPLNVLQLVLLQSVQSSWSICPFTGYLTISSCTCSARPLMNLQLLMASYTQWTSPIGPHGNCKGSHMHKINYTAPINQVTINWSGNVSGAGSSAEFKVKRERNPLF